MITGQHCAGLLHLQLQAAAVIGNWVSATEPNTHGAEEPVTKRGYVVTARSNKRLLGVAHPPYVRARTVSITFTSLGPLGCRLPSGRAISLHSIGVTGEDRNV